MQEGDAARANMTAERTGEGSINNSQGEGARRGSHRGAKILSISNNNNRDSLTPPLGGSGTGGKRWVYVGGNGRGGKRRVYVGGSGRERKRCV